MRRLKRQKGDLLLTRMDIFFLLIFAFKLSRPLHRKNTPMVLQCKSHQQFINPPTTETNAQAWKGSGEAAEQ